jgi:4-hydroxyphenylpyruvate dioxygenase
MRARDVPLLPIPGNYYADLAASSTTPSPGAGELLHVYTAMVGPELFFELVERRGGYDGYGAANAAVRVAAQR